MSLAERYKLKPEDAAQKLAAYFKSVGADMVLDMTVAEDFALIESAKEFVERYKTAKEGSKNQLPMLASSCPGKNPHIIPYLIVQFDYYIELSVRMGLLCRKNTRKLHSSIHQCHKVTTTNYGIFDKISSS